MRLLGGTIRPVENLAAILQLALDAGGKWVLLRMSSAADLATDLATEPPELFSEFQVTRFTAIRSTRSSRHSGCSESAAPGLIIFMCSAPPGYDDHHERPLLAHAEGGNARAQGTTLRPHSPH